MVKYDFEDKIIIVTGGANGIGAAAIKKFVRFGGRVHNWDKLESSISGVKNYKVDISVSKSIQKALSSTLKKDKQIDILFNNAGVFGSSVSLEKSDPKEWKKVIETNLIGTYEVCRQVVPHISKNKVSHIVNMASLAGKEGTPEASAYSASKAAIIALTKSLAKELADRRILVNAIAPAAIETAILDQMSSKFVAKMIEKSPMKRLGEVEEVANLVCWLCSSDCSFNTGAIFDLSGGRATY